MELVLHAQSTSRSQCWTNQISMLSPANNLTALRRKRPLRSPGGRKLDLTSIWFFNNCKPTRLQDCKALSPATVNGIVALSTAYCLPFFAMVSFLLMLVLFPLCAVKVWP